MLGNGVGLPSSSRVNDAGVNGADAVKLNGVGPSGTESFTIVIEPGAKFVIVTAMVWSNAIVTIGGVEVATPPTT